MNNLLLILIAAILGLLSHLSKNRDWLSWVLRTVIFLTALLEFGGLATVSLGDGFINSSPTIITALKILFPATCLLLFMPARQLLSWLFTSLDLIVTGQILLPLIRKKIKAAEYFLRKKIFMPSSFPHLVALFIYITAAAYLLISIDNSITFSGISKPLPIPSLLGLIVLSFCGVGIYISRSCKEACSRLGLVKVSKTQIGIGIFLILASFTYDAIWPYFTHRLAGQDLATELSYYNPGTFMMAGPFVASIILALAIAFIGSVGEELLIRGALQPVFGILPAALFQGILHAQFAHAPVFIIKVTIWSIVMGLIRRYTNTSTTIIAHAGFSLITILLFASNP